MTIDAMIESPWEGMVETHEGPTFVKTTGQGPLLFVIHGGPGFDYRYLYDNLSFVAKTRTLVFYDQPGCGRTPAPTSGPSFAGTVKHFCALVQSLSSGQDFGLVAHSWGTLVAISALAGPGNASLKSLTEGLLINPVPVTRQEYDSCANNLLSRIPAETLERVAAMMASGIAGSRVMDALLPYYHSRKIDLPDVSLPFRYDTYSTVNETLGDFDYSQQLSSVENLELVRGADDFTSAELISGLAKSVSDVHEMPSVGHFPFYEEKNEFERTVRQIFL